MRSVKPANHIDSTGKTKKTTGLTCFQILPEEKYIECAVCMNPLYENVNIIEVNVDISITFSLQMNEDRSYKKIKDGDL